jgi:hypothetical protein
MIVNMGSRQRSEGPAGGAHGADRASKSFRAA